MLTLAIIVAVADNGVIGRGDALPWHLPDDLQYFKSVTMGKPIVMGRKTFESIGRPLPGRTNIVISRDPAYRPHGATAVTSLPDALSLAEDVALIDGVEEALVIGGAEIYALALPLAGRLYVTEVHASVEGDVVFPQVDWGRWREVSRQRRDAVDPNPYDYSFVVYERA
ncbi:MAG: dihydrofolate reductase [Halioglobus sp.]|nr:dihydrofolate reductase [Halioglobus sp.]